MAMNPMQKKANKYLILGILGTLLITGSIIAFLFVQMNNLNQQIAAQNKKLTRIYVLSADVESGAELTTGILSEKEVSSDGIPTDAISIDYIMTANAEGKQVIAKIPLTSGTILTSEMLTYSDDVLTDDQRIQEYNMIILPTDLKSGEYIDIRLMLPTGADYIVASKKKVEVPIIAGVDSTTTIWLTMSEEEILMVDSAIIDAYRIEGSYLYATRYVEAGNQQAASTTYIPTAEVVTLIRDNLRATDEAKNALQDRYRNYRGPIETQVNIYAEDAQDNLIDGMADRIQQALDDRQAYLEGLAE